MNDMRILDTGGLLVDEFLEAINRAGSVDGDRCRAATILLDHGNQIEAILEKLTRQPLPDHIRHYLEHSRGAESDLRRGDQQLRAVSSTASSSRSPPPGLCSPSS